MAATAAPTSPRAGLQPWSAGIATALVGFCSSFAIVLAGMRAVGADRAQSASGLLVLSVGMGLLAIVLSWRLRMPVSMAWSTPGMALMVATGAVQGGYPAALGACLLAALLTIAAGLWGRFGRWIGAIPVPLASALLAGVLLPICLAPVHALVELPWQAAPVIGVWAVLMRVARPWAVPGALVAAAAAIAIGGSLGAGAADHPWPVLRVTAPTAELATLVGLGLPLFVVTMASQNLTGLGVLRLHGYAPPLRPLLLGTGAVSAAIAPFGGTGVNLAAITAAMVAGPDAHPDPRRRWVAASAAGVAYLVIGLLSGLVTALIAASPPLLVEAVAGLALLGALGAALQAAMADPARREAAVLVLVVAVSGIAPLHISGPFWGLLAGLAYLGVQHRRGA
jgi:benzoate membrane transport protein